MSKKYLSATPPTIITNDLFLASFLHCVGCTLDRIEKNERRRVSFVFTGERCRELRESYRTGRVSLDIKLFRDSMNFIRDRMNEALLPAPSLRQAGASSADQLPEQRRMSHVSSHSLQPVPQY
jgi:hypothetical protein